MHLVLTSLESKKLLFNQLDRLIVQFQDKRDRETESKISRLQARRLWKKWPLYVRLFRKVKKPDGYYEPYSQSDIDNCSRQIQKWGQKQTLVLRALNHEDSVSLAEDEIFLLTMRLPKVEDEP